MKTHALIRMITLSALLVLAAPVLGNAAAGKSGDGKAAPAQSAPAQAAPADGKGQPQAQEEDDLFAGLRPVKGPATVKLGTQGQAKIPDGLIFFNAKDTRTLLERLENLTSGDELGLVGTPDLKWLAVFAFDNSGYVEDTGDAADIDAKALLQSIKDNVAEANKEKAARGWAPSEVVGWAIPPHYNKETKNLEWSVRFKSSGHEYDNYNVRILGREGVMRVIFVGDQDGYAQSLQAARSVMADYSFSAGKTHAEWRQGDKVAGYGLAALIAGGAAAAAAKSGLLGKFIKPIGIAILAGLAAIGKLFRRKKKGDNKFEAPDQNEPGGPSDPTEK